MTKISNSFLDEFDKASKKMEGVALSSKSFF